MDILRVKRGQEMSTNTLILIILGVIVLVILALGFSIGWNRFLPFLSSNNVDNIKTTCATACTTNDKYNYCSFQRTLQSTDLPGGQALGNCTWFATQPAYTKYGISLCPSIPPISCTS